MADHLIWWILGFVPGGILGGYLVGRWCGKEYRKRIDILTEENKGLSKRLSEKRASDFQKREEAAKRKEEELEKNRIESEKLVSSLRYRADEDEEEKDVEVLEVDLEEDADSEYDWTMEDTENDIENPEEDDGAIRMISPEDFKQLLSKKDAETLTYYQMDGILTDENDEPIHGQMNILGEDCMDIIEETTEDYLYIDNEIEDKIYEVVVERNESFYRDVAGAYAAE